MRQCLEIKVCRLDSRGQIDRRPAGTLPGKETAVVDLVDKGRVDRAPAFVDTLPVAGDHAAKEMPGAGPLIPRLVPLTGLPVVTNESLGVGLAEHERGIKPFWQGLQERILGDADL